MCLNSSSMMRKQFTIFVFLLTTALAFTPTYQLPRQYDSNVYSGTPFFLAVNTTLNFTGSDFINDDFENNNLTNWTKFAGFSCFQMNITTTAKNGNYALNLTDPDPITCGTIRAQRTINQNLTDTASFYNLTFWYRVPCIENFTTWSDGNLAAVFLQDDLNDQFYYNFPSNNCDQWIYFNKNLLNYQSSSTPSWTRNRIVKFLILIDVTQDFPTTPNTTALFDDVRIIKIKEQPQINFTAPGYRTGYAVEVWNGTTNTTSQFIISTTGGNVSFTGNPVFANQIEFYDVRWRAWAPYFATPGTFVGAIKAGSNWNVTFTNPRFISPVNLSYSNLHLRLLYNTAPAGADCSGQNCSAGSNFAELFSPSITGNTTGNTISTTLNLLISGTTVPTIPEFRTESLTNLERFAYVASTDALLVSRLNSSYYSADTGYPNWTFVGFRQYNSSGLQAFAVPPVAGAWTVNSTSILLDRMCWVDGCAQGYNLTTAGNSLIINQTFAGGSVQANYTFVDPVKTKVNLTLRGAGNYSLWIADRPLTPQSGNPVIAAYSESETNNEFAATVRNWVAFTGAGANNSARGYLFANVPNKVYGVVGTTASRLNTTLTVDGATALNGVNGFYSVINYEAQGVNGARDFIYYLVNGPAPLATTATRDFISGQISGSYYTLTEGSQTTYRNSTAEVLGSVPVSVASKNIATDTTTLSINNLDSVNYTLTSVSFTACTGSRTISSVTYRSHTGAVNGAVPQANYSISSCVVTVQNLLVEPATASNVLTVNFVPADQSGGGESGGSPPAGGGGAVAPPAIYSLNVTYPERIEVFPNETVSFDFIVQSTGTATETVTLSFSQSLCCTVQEFAPVTLLSGSSHKFTVSLRAGSVPSASYFVSFTAASAGSRKSGIITVVVRERTQPVRTVRIVQIADEILVSYSSLTFVERMILLITLLSLLLKLRAEKRMEIMFKLREYLDKKKDEAFEQIRK